MRYLAIDYGIKRTGLAVCDAGETIASPLKVLQGQRRLVEEIEQIVTPRVRRKVKLMHGHLQF